MFRVLECSTADNMWHDAAKWFGEGDSAVCQSRGGLVYEINNAALSLLEPRQRWIASRQPALNPAFAIAEIVWILNGRNDAAFLNYFNSQLPRFAGHTSRYHGAYGYRLRKHFGMDQLQRAHDALLADPISRQIVLQIWDSQSDLPLPDGSPSAPDIPCNIASILRVREGRLQWTQIMRSNDLMRGLPYNVVQFTTLQEVMAGWLGLEVGAYHHLSDNLHVYAENINDLNEIRPVKCPANNDTLNLPKEFSENCFSNLAAMIELIIDPTQDGNALLQLLTQSKLPSGFRNLLCILIAEGLRRRGEHHLISNAMGECQNPCLIFMFQRWLDRLLKTSPSDCM